MVSLFSDSVHGEEEEEEHMVCGGLRSYIEDCTVILGWCYTAAQVERTKEKQQAIMRKAMAKIFPEFDVDVSWQATKKRDD